MLTVEYLSVNYGRVEAVCKMSFSVPARGLVAILGANGAGKSTTLLTLAGAIRPQAGRIRFLDQDITRWPVHRVARAGLVLVPEGRRVLAPLTVQENLELGGYCLPNSAVAAGLKRVYSRFPQLGTRRQQRAGSLSGGEQQMLAIGRGLMAAPRLLMLDEPSLGLAPLLVDEVFSIIKEIHAEGTSVVLVEQNANMALQLADYAYVLERGCIVYEGKAEDLRHDQRVVEAYLG